MWRQMTWVMLMLVLPSYASNVLIYRGAANQGGIVKIESQLRQLGVLISEEPMRVEWSESLRISSSHKEIAVAPFIGVMRSGRNERLRKCLLLIVDTTGTKVVERSLTGFSDDFEPCESIRLHSVVDVNSDGTTDLVYAIRMIDASGRGYVLLDAYLLSREFDVCFSPKASVRLSSKFLAEGSSGGLTLTSEAIKNDPILRESGCPFLH